MYVYINIYLYIGYIILILIYNTLCGAYNFFFFYINIKLNCTVSNKYYQLEQ